MSNKMNPEIKAKWVAALRSGEYKQGVNYLRNRAGSYCCLGVLCELVDPNGWFVDECGNSRFHDETGLVGLPESVCAATGVPAYGSFVEIGGIRAPLSTHNDGDRDTPSRTFAEIADAIEVQL